MNITITMNTNNAILVGIHEEFKKLTSNKQFSALNSEEFEKLTKMSEFENLFSRMLSIDGKGKTTSHGVVQDTTSTIQQADKLVKDDGCGTPNKKDKNTKKQTKLSNKQHLEKHLSNLSDLGRSVTQIYSGKETKQERSLKSKHNAYLANRAYKSFGPDRTAKSNEYPHLSPKDFRKVSLFQQKVNAANKKWRQDKISHRRMSKYMIAEPQSLFGVDINIPQLENLTSFLEDQTKNVNGESFFSEFVEFKKTIIKGFDCLLFSIDQLSLINCLVAVFNCNANRTPQNAVYLGFSLVWVYVQFSGKITAHLSTVVSEGLKVVHLFSGEKSAKPSTAEPQIDVETIGECSTLLTGILSLWTNLYCPRARLPAKLLEQLTHFDKTKNSISAIMTFVFSKIQLLTDWLAEYFETSSPFAFLSSNEDKYKSVISDVRGLFDKFTSGAMVYDESTFDKVSRAHSDVEELLLKIPRRPETSPMVELLRQVDSSIKKIYISFISQGFQSSGYRQEPVSCMFYGRPGIGKSNLINSLAASMVGSFLDLEQIESFKKDSSKEIYNRQAETKYWDGYQGQFVTTFDDLGQMKDVAGNPDNEWMNVIRAVNSFEYLLHMADLPKKGSTFFRSKFVFATTNLEQFKPSSIISVDAFNRRWDFQLSVDLEPKYSIPSKTTAAIINWKKAKADGIEGMSPRLLRFQLKDNPGNWFNFDKLVELVSARYLEKKRWHATNKAGFESYADKYSSRRNLQRNDPSLSKIADSYAQRRKFAATPQSGLAERIKDMTARTNWYKDVEESIQLSKNFKDGAYLLVRRLKDVFTLQGTVVMLLGSLCGYMLSNLIKVFVVPSVVTSWNYLSRLLFGVSRQESEIKQLNSKPRQEAKVKTRLVQKQQGSPTARFADGLLDKNVVEIHLSRPTGERLRLGCGLMVEGKTLLLPKHFTTQLLSEVVQEGRSLEDVNSDCLKTDCLAYRVSVGSFDFSVVDFLSGSLDDEMLLENDLALVFLPGPLPAARSIVKSFISVPELLSLPKSNHVTLQRVTEGKVHVTYTRAATVERVPVCDKAFGDYEILRGWKYSAATQRGDCGSVLLTNCYKQNKSLILGLHVAGMPSAELGFGGLITREELERCLIAIRDEFGGPVPVADKHIDSTAMPQSGVLPPDSQVSYLGRSQTRMFTSTQTSLFKSFLFDQETSTKAPALLHVKDGIDPFSIALSKYVMPKRPISSRDVRLFGSCVFDTISVLVKDTNHRTVFAPLSFEDAVLGVSSFGELKSITRSTSAGFPYNCTPSISKLKKRYFFGDGQDFDFSSRECQDLKSRVLAQLNMLRNGLTPDWIFVDALKDELRELSKVQAGKTRLFSVAPIELIIVSRMIFGNLMAHTTSKRIFNGFATGVNPYDPSEWEGIKKHLSGVSQSKDKVFVGAGDFSGFDASEHPALLHEIFKVLGDFYGEHAIVVEAFSRSVTNSTHMFQNEFYSWYGSMPSGHPLTTFVNNILNISSFRYCFKSTHPDKSFDQHVRIIVQGDDNLWSPSQQVQDTFTEPKVAEIMKTLNLTYTSDTKGDFSGHWRKLEEVQFLKRRFVKFSSVEHQNIWIAPLSTDTLINMPMWKDFDTLLQIMEILQLEWSLHGETAYRERFLPLVTSFIDAYQENSPQIVLLPWKMAFNKAITTRDVSW